MLNSITKVNKKLSGNNKKHSSKSDLSVSKGTAKLSFEYDDLSTSSPSETVTLCAPLNINDNDEAKEVFDRLEISDDAATMTDFIFIKTRRSNIDQFKLSRSIAKRARRNGQYKILQENFKNFFANLPNH